MKSAVSGIVLVNLFFVATFVCAAPGRAFPR